MVSHAISDRDTMNIMSTDGGSLPKRDHVDLGLPSGTLWATENIKDDDGNELYFAWGETHGYTRKQIIGNIAFNWSDYEFGTKNSLRKYNENDGLTVLESKDDAAVVNWGEEWKIPTLDQVLEMVANTVYVWTEIGGVPGLKLISTIEGYADKFLFFPTTGFAIDSDVSELEVFDLWWASSLNKGKTYGAYSWGYVNATDSPYPHGLWKITTHRCLGCPVRPVRAQGINRARGTEGTQGSQSNEGTQGSQGSEGTQGTQGV